MDAQKNFKITLFVDRPKAERRLVAMQNGETREEAAVRSIRQRTASELQRPPAGVPPDLWEVLMFRRVEYRTGDGWLLGHSGDTEDKDRG